eukprot:CAMPEP_0115688274 /NCGR_PEP_ID=MMETSP0272-20121206/60926_1 /TAXON_ID=71861 /ORGANISM="Scrippsiella trochoidea, Strain CCMP3099" /LENGTH=54 /DNA_ID=CAMNT_0003127957 /DNA_START=56 /DNA_END=216 /DNA_ORIENTATION=-
MVSGGGGGATLEDETEASWTKPTEMPVPAIPPGASVGGGVPPLLTKMRSSLESS